MTVARASADVMQTLDALKVIPVWVDPHHRVDSARVLMDGHDLSAITVLDRDGKPVGALRREVAANLPGNARVGEVMEPVSGVLASTESLRHAADLLVSTGRHFAPMVQGEEYRGMVTALDLLDGLRRSWDPMTDLSWSDELRRWGATQLDEGREIAIVFIDLDRFGTFNKRFGHVVGDRVLKRVAAFLCDRIDASTDLLVRYGGDEFAIGTLRSGDGAQALADGLLKSSRETPLIESGEAISFSVGVYGGQRQRERGDVHVQATLDDLINLASRRCLASKPDAADGSESISAPRQEAPSEAVASEEPFPALAVVRVTEAEEALEASVPGGEEPEVPRVVEVKIEDDPNSLTHVVLKGGGRVWVGVGLRLGRTLESTVAYATGKALERAYAGRTLRIDAVRESEGRFVVEATRTENGDERAVSATTEDASPEAVADATIQAFLA